MERFTHAELCALLATTKSQAVLVRVQDELRARAGTHALPMTPRIMARIEREAYADNRNKR